LKVSLVYDTKYGNTKHVAEEIMQGIKEVDWMETEIGNIKDVTLEKLADADLILIGSPNHMGRPTGTASGLIDELGKTPLKAKWVAVFDTYGGNDFEKAVRKMEQKLAEKVPGLKILAPGLSIKVNGMKGPIVEGELPKCRDFGKKLANQLKA